MWSIQTACPARLGIHSFVKKEINYADWLLTSAHTPVNWLAQEMHGECPVILGPQVPWLSAAYDETG
jgi:hypothetical protein